MASGQFVWKLSQPILGKDAARGQSFHELEQVKPSQGTMLVVPRFVGKARVDGKLTESFHTPPRDLKFCWRSC